MRKTIKSRFRGSKVKRSKVKRKRWISRLRN